MPVQTASKRKVGKKSLTEAEISAGFKYGLSKNSSNKEKKETTETLKIAFEVLPHSRKSITIDFIWESGEYRHIGKIERQHNWKDESGNKEGKIIEKIDKALISESTEEGRHSGKITVVPVEWLLPCLKCEATDPPDPKNN